MHAEYLGLRGGPVGKRCLSVMTASFEYEWIGRSRRVCGGGGPPQAKRYFSSLGCPTRFSFCFGMCNVFHVGGGKERHIWGLPRAAKPPDTRPAGA